MGKENLMTCSVISEEMKPNMSPVAEYFGSSLFSNNKLNVIMSLHFSKFKDVLSLKHNGI